MGLLSSTLELKENNMKKGDRVVRIITDNYPVCKVGDIGIVTEGPFELGPKGTQRLFVKVDFGIDCFAPEFPRGYRGPEYCDVQFMEVL